MEENKSLKVCVNGEHHSGKEVSKSVQVKVVALSARIDAHSQLCAYPEVLGDKPQCAQCLSTGPNSYAVIDQEQCQHSTAVANYLLAPSCVVHDIRHLQFPDSLFQVLTPKSHEPDGGE